MTREYDVFLGLDVGKTAHHGCALTATGERLYDRELPQDETALRAVIEQLQDDGLVLVVVDQPNTIGALPIAVARACGATVAYLPGLAMRKSADLYPGRSKTDARDAFIIADTPRTMPHTLRAVDRDSDLLSALKVLAGFDDDLARECTRAINRLRSLLVQIYPWLERVFVGTILTRPIVLELLIRYHGPEGLKAAGKSGVKRWAKNHTRKDPSILIDQILAALAEQTVTVPGATTVELIIPRVAAQIKELKAQRALVATEAEAMVDTHPLTQVLISMPGVGIKTAATILLTAGDFSSFPTPGHLAAYAGIAPVTRRSGTSIRGEFPVRSGNKQLKNALFRSAWVASCHDPVSKAYYDRKRAEGKKHNAAVICLARRRLNVLYAMVRDGSFYQTTPEHIPQAA
ncbi:IS110 family transposase [Auritidibacter sp. NML130574]|uniref:IS110 family transposase n=1 Tax=Auritidibacter sp. NML130574 TaxID=2170745 RepID=UPI000D73509A|nr:IS110 family transposase [Auritidibacter sp. NML130574]AXR74011.1 IS110 family transposase [Auritidibacter sp. NML130574]